MIVHILTTLTIIRITTNEEIAMTVIYSHIRMMMNNRMGIVNILLVFTLFNFTPMPAKGFSDFLEIGCSVIWLTEYEQNNNSIDDSTIPDKDTIESPTTEASEDLLCDITTYNVLQCEKFTGVRNLVLRGGEQCADLFSVNRCNHLEALEVHDLILDRMFVEKILLLQNLGKLTLVSSSIGAEEFCLLCGHKNISTLDIYDAKIPDTSLICLSDLKNLRSVRLPSNANDLVLNALSKNEKLEDLFADGTKITDAGISQIAKLSRLKSLSLSRTNVTGTTLFEIWQVRNLRRLDLSDTLLTDKTACGLIQLNNVEELIIDHTECTDKTLLYISKLQKLCVLSIEGTNISGEGFEHFSESSNIEQLKLAFSEITKRGLEALQKFPRLWYLEIQETDLDETAFSIISKLENLEALILSVNNDKSAIEDLRKKLPKTSIMALPRYGKCPD